MFLVRGHGIYEKGKYRATVSGENTKEYNLWSNMLKRCYNEVFHEEQSSYKDCSVSDNFKNFQFFAEWCNNQIGFGLDDWQLDKDILVKGNKIYSEDTCVFVPREINSLLICKKSSRGVYPIGVHLHKQTGKFRAMATVGDVKEKHLGLFDCPEKAFIVYKKAKEEDIKNKANKYKDLLDSRVYEALINYVVNIDD